MTYILANINIRGFLSILGHLEVKSALRLLIYNSKSKDFYMVM